MLNIFNKYQIPSEIQGFIYEYLKEKDKYNEVVKEIPQGIHRSYVKGDLNNWKAYDIFKKQFKKYSIVVRLKDLYEFDEWPVPHGLSSSAPIFTCKLCRKYHQVGYYGDKYCPSLCKYID